MKLNPNRAKLKLLLLCATAVNFSAFADNYTADEGVTTTQTGSSYNDSDPTLSALNVSGNNTVYNGTDIILSATTNSDGSSVFGNGAYVTDGAALSLTGGTVTTSGSYGHGVYIFANGSGTLNNVTIETNGVNARGLYVTNSATLTLTNSDITTTGSIEIGGTVTIDFSNLTETGEYNLLNWTGATVTGDITDSTFTNETAGVEGTFSVANNQLTFNATAVPEPSTWFLMGAGLGLLLLTAHYRRRKAQS